MKEIQSTLSFILKCLANHLWPSMLKEEENHYSDTLQGTNVLSDSCYFVQNNAVSRQPQH